MRGGASAIPRWKWCNAISPCGTPHAYFFCALLEGKARSDDKTALLRSAIGVDINHVVGLRLHCVAIRRWEIDDPDVESHQTILLGDHPMLVVLLIRHGDHVAPCGDPIL